jgi:hypothetical protein
VHLPHKPLCNAIHSLRTLLQLNKITDWESWMLRTIDTKVAPGRQARHFLELCSSKSLDLEHSQTITNGLLALKEAKRAQLDKLT